VGGSGLGIAIVWWPLAMAFSIGYGVYVFRQFRGKVRLGTPPSPAH
jgi:cytochrome oxidase assembly protein ShyY1